MAAESASPLLEHARIVFAQTEPALRRAELLEQLISCVIEVTATRFPGGEGVDRRDGPEQRRLSIVLSAAIAHADVERRQAARR